MRPLALIEPSVGAVTRDNSFNKVDFPAPFFPIIPTISPCFTSKEISFKAHTYPLFVFFERSLTSPILRYGSSFPLTRCHHLFISWLIVPVPTVPNLYCFDIPSNLSLYLTYVQYFNYTISINFRSILLKIQEPNMTRTMVTTKLYPRAHHENAPSP